MLVIIYKVHAFLTNKTESNLNIMRLWRLWRNPEGTSRGAWKAWEVLMIVANAPECADESHWTLVQNSAVPTGSAPFYCVPTSKFNNVQLNFLYSQWWVNISVLLPCTATVKMLYSKSCVHCGTATLYMPPGPYSSALYIGQCLITYPIGFVRRIFFNHAEGEVHYVSF